MTQTHPRYNGRVLPAVIVRASITITDRLAGERRPTCTVVTAINDKEFGMWRAKQGFRCNGPELAECASTRASRPRALGRGLSGRIGGLLREGPVRKGPSPRRRDHPVSLGWGHEPICGSRPKPLLSPGLGCRLARTLQITFPASEVTARAQSNSFAGA